MALERDLAQKFLYLESGKIRPVVRISSVGIALGVSLILLSLFVVRGFKQEIDQKINRFVGTIRISNPDNNYDQYAIPLTINPQAKEEILSASKERFSEAHLNAFIDQMALVKVDSAFRAIVMHGVDEGYDTHFFSQYLVKGKLPNLKERGEILLSQKIAQYLDVTVGDVFRAYYMDGESVKVRKYEIVGLMNTGFDTYDEHIAITSISELQGIKGWSENQVSGLTVTIDSRKGSSQLYERLFSVLADRNSQYGERYAMYTVEELNYNYFGWLDLLDANVLLILVLMIAVAAITIITGVVVLILEKVRAIATLKALGQRNRSIQKTFRIMASNILLRGVLYSNVIAIVLGLIEKYFKFIPLDPSQYYMSYVPIVINWGVVLITNIIVFVIVFLVVLIPTRIIGSVNPSKTLRFE